MKHFPHTKFPNVCCANKQTLTFKKNTTCLKQFIFIRGESQCVITTLAWGGEGREAFTNDVLKSRRIIEFESSFIVIGFSYIYLIIDKKRSFSN